MVAGGRIGVDFNTGSRSWKEWLPEGVRSTEPMTTGTHEQAVLESVASNLEAGIEMVGHQEVCLAKIGGRFPRPCLSIMREGPSAMTRKECPCRFDSRHRETKLENWLINFDNTALFSKGPAKPLPLSVLTHGEWEGISLDDWANIEQPGLTTIDQGNCDAPGYNLDLRSVKRALDEWRSLCINNRMQGLLMDRLWHGANQSLSVLMNGCYQFPKFLKKLCSLATCRSKRNN